MNDFTKKELQEIYNGLDDYPEIIYLKLQSMIENYCEHEANKEIYSIRNSRLGAEKMINKCKKCGEFYG